MFKQSKFKKVFIETGKEIKDCMNKGKLVQFKEGKIFYLERI